MRPSANSKTMTATSTPMRLKSMLLRVARSARGLTAAPVWVNDGNWRQARAVVRRKPSFGLAFPGDRRTDDNFRLLSLLGQAYPRRRDASLPRLLGLYFPRPNERGILGLHAAQLWSAILRGLRQWTSRIRRRLPTCSSPRTPRLFLRSAVHLVSSSSRVLRRCRKCANSRHCPPT
jgi:hypothetical protein